jgi:hypothetical protein
MLFQLAALLIVGEIIPLSTSFAISGSFTVLNGETGLRAGPGKRPAKTDHCNATDPQEYPVIHGHMMGHIFNVVKFQQVVVYHALDHVE